MAKSHPAEKRRSKSEPISSDVSSEETDTQQPTMWLGTEDGNIHVYNCSDNIRIKKNKVKIQHGCAVHSIMWVPRIRIFIWRRRFYIAFLLQSLGQPSFCSVSERGYRSLRQRSM